MAVAAPRFVHHHQVVALWIRERAQQYLIDDGEDGGVGANAEREREHGGNREARAASKPAAHVPRITQHVLEEMAGANLMAGFFLLEHAAKPPPRLEPRICFVHSPAYELARL